MGILDSAGQAAKGATDAVADSVVGKTIDAVAGGLTGESGSAATGTACFVAGEPLDPRLASRPRIAAQPNPVGSPNNTGARSGESVPFGPRRPVQFVHLSHAHDDLADNLPGQSPVHGVGMRDALVREAVLVHAFARSAQRVLQAAKDGKGAAGAMLDTAGSLLGGKTQAAAGPETIDPVLAQVRAAVDPVNAAEIGYPDLHLAGVKLAEAWANLHETCKTALDPKAGGGAGLPSIPGLSQLAGSAGIPEVVAKIPEWLFKVHDTYTALYRNARQAYEWDVMKACHDYSVQAISERRKPGYDIWFLLAEKQGEPAGEASGVEQTLQQAQDNLRGLPLVGDSEPVDAAAGALGSVQDAIRGAREGARDQAGDITGWLATVESEQARLPEGSAAALAAAIAALAGDPQNPQRSPPLATVMARGFAQGIGVDALPGFLQTYVGIVSDIAMTLLPKLYSHLHGQLGVPQMPLVLAATHDAVAGRIVDLVWALIFGKDSKPGSNDGADMTRRGTDLVDGLSQGSLATGGLPGLTELENKAADLVRQFIRGNAHYMDALVLFVAEDLFREMVFAWIECAGKRCLCMEAYLGRLPLMAALLVRNLAFPVFNLLLKAFGMADRFAGMAWDPVDQKLKEGGQIARDIQQYKEDVRQTGNDIAAGARRAEDEIGSQQQELRDNAGALAEGGRVDSLDSARQMAGDKQRQANALADTVGTAPDDIIDAATNDPAAAAPAAAAASGGTGPLSAARVVEGQARAVEPGEIDQAGRVRVMPEDQARAARDKAPPPVAPPAAPALPF